MTPRDLQTVKVVTYTSAFDSYGEASTTESSTRDVDMCIYLYQQREVQDPRYNDVECVGLTKDENITTSNAIKVGDIRYQILHIIPSRRWNSLLLKQLS